MILKCSTWVENVCKNIDIGKNSGNVTKQAITKDFKTSTRQRYLNSLTEGRI